jgi:X-linked retinitis pigmentosa GTPase regulator
MPEENKMNTENKEIVDIDTSGPEVDVELKEEKNEKDTENNIQPVDTSEKLDEQSDIKVEEVKPETETETETKEQETKPETKKDELKEYSEGVQKRIAKLTKKMREAERQRDEATRYAKSVLEKQKAAESKLLKIEPSYIESLEASVKSGMEAAVAKLAQAREAGDIKSEVEAQKEIARLGVQEAKVMAQKSNIQTKATDVKEPTLDQAIEKQPEPAEPDPKAEEWASKNRWFGTDSAMTYTAFDIHKKLTEEEGYDPKSDDYYSEVDKRIRLEFPHKFDNTESKETTKPTQTVASAKRSVKSSRKTVRLTPSQVSIARKLGVPLEEYAKQLQLTKEV